jgi:hypothetical protein
MQISDFVQSRQPILVSCEREMVDQGGSKVLACNPVISGVATAPVGGHGTPKDFFFFFPYQWDSWHKKKKILFLIMILKYNEKLSLELCQISSIKCSNSNN